MLELLKERGPMCGKVIARLLKMEVSSVCRTINDLKNEMVPLIRVAYIDRSPVSGKRVEFYCYINWIPPKTGLQLTIL